MQKIPLWTFKVYGSHMNSNALIDTCFDAKQETHRLENMRICAEFGSIYSDVTTHINLIQ